MCKLEDYKEVHADDFMRIGGEPPPHRKIEEALLRIGGSGKHAAAFKQSALKAAGWKYDRMTGYAKNTELAATAFNKIRLILAETEDKEKLIETLKEQQAAEEVV